MGSAEVFLRKRPSEREIINDYNGDLVKFFRVLQRSEKLAYLIGRLYLSFNSEQLFKANKAMLADVPNILDDLTETSVIIENADWSDIEKAVAFFENQIFSFSSTGKTFAIAKKDMTKRFGRLVAACSRLRNAVIMHRDYKDCIAYAAGKDTFILLDPPYKGTENYYQKASFGSDEHAMLFEFMNGVHEKYKGECKFIITYNNDPYIVDLANKYGFDTYVQKRLHNMAQSTKPGEMFEELLIGNFNLLDQAELNNKYLLEQTRQLTLFDFSAIEETLDEEFAEYQRQLDEQINKMNKALDHSKGTPLTEEETKEIKKVYRNIVKALHPDLHPEVTPAQVQLFQNAVEAYEHGDLNSLRIISTMVAEPIVVEPSESALTVLAKEKERLLKTLELIREQIAEIKSEFPYTMKELVESPEKIAEKKAEIEETLAELKEAYDFYSARLKEMLR